MSESYTGQRSRRVFPAGGRADRAPVGRVCGMRGMMRGRGGFTLVELLVVVSIIVILMGILIPTVSYVRTAARVASTQSVMVQLQGAIEQYYQDFRAYPGPLSNDVLYVTPGGGVNFVNGRVTGTENLVLGLLGGLYYDTGTNLVTYDATRVGRGPATLAPAGINTNRAHSAYLASTANLTTTCQNNDPANPGHFKDAVGEANDSNIPEFVDTFPSPMPILYLRARVGAPASIQWGGGVKRYYVIGDANNLRGTGAMGAVGAAQYDINQIYGYVGSFTGVWPGSIAGAALNAQDQPQAGFCIGEGKSAQYYFAGKGPFSPSDLLQQAGIPPYHGLYAMLPYPAGPVAAPNVSIPFTAPAYFRNPALAPTNPPPYFTNSQEQPRGKDSYILISAGADRVYGTADDITSFGAVLP